MKHKYDVLHPLSSSFDKELPPIIFLHGMLDCRRTWKKTAPDIVQKTGRMAYVVDARNHGESPWSEEKMDYDILTKDLLNFMNEQLIEKAVIIGHSMGGRTAINFALKHPERVDALIVEDMTPKNIPMKNFAIVPIVIRTGKELLAGLPGDSNLEAAKQLILNTLMAFGTEKLVNKDKFTKLYELDMMPIKKVGSTFTTEANLDAAMSMVLSDTLVQNLPESNLIYDGEALFLQGSRSFFNLEKDRSIKKLFPRATVKKIDGASHFIHVDSADSFVDSVSEFIWRKNIPSSKY